VREYKCDREEVLVMRFSVNFLPSGFLISSSIIATVILTLSSPSFAESNERPGLLKNEYRHVCPKGTERVGEGPPSTSVVFCKQLLYNGSRMEGEYAKFYQNGNKQFQGTYEQGKKHGTWVSYYRTGEIREVKKFQDGQEIKSTQYKRDGSEIKKQELNKNKAEMESKVYSDLRRTRKGGKRTTQTPLSLGWPRK
jgi:hypothetical protein